MDKSINTKEIGDAGEDIACRYLLKNKYAIIGRNVYVQKNELDIVAIYKKTLVIVEVKTSQVSRETLENREYVRPFSRITDKKMQSLYYAAKNYVSGHGYDIESVKYRIDVMLILIDRKDRRAYLRHTKDVRSF